MKEEDLNTPGIIYDELLKVAKAHHPHDGDFDDCKDKKCKKAKKLFAKLKKCKDIECSKKIIEEMKAI